jgi:hypothetical protein
MTTPNRRNRIKDTLWVFNSPKYLRKIRSTPPFSDVKRAIVFMGLHLYQQHSKRIETYCDELRQNGYKVLQVVLYPTRDPKTISVQQSSDNLHLCLKDITFLGFPQKTILDKLNAYNADIFINLNGDFAYSDMGFAISSAAPYRISPYQKEYQPYFNILFRSRTEEDLDAYLLRITDFFKHLT